MRDENIHQHLYDDLHFDELEPVEEVTAEYAKEFFPIFREERIETMAEPVIIECAYPGWQPGGDHYPAVPMDKETQVEELIEAVDAGAAAVHVHPRDENGVAQMDDEALLVEILEPVFEACGDIVTLSHTWRPATEENMHADYVTTVRELLEMGDGNKYCQAAVVLPPGHHTEAYFSKSSTLEAIRYFEENQIKPMYMLYDSHVIYDLKHHFYDQGEMNLEPHLVSVQAGKHHSHAVHKDPWSYLHIVSAMNTVQDTIPNTVLSLVPGGRNWLPILVLGMIAGVTVFRVGIEETYWMYPHRDDIVQRNIDLIELAVDIAESLGREVITDPDRARDHLGLEYTS